MSKESHKRTLIKTISWRLIALFVTFAVAYVIMGSLKGALTIGILANAIKMAAYYAHERLWDKVKFGKPFIPEKGFVLWFTGLSGAGKSTLAEAVRRELNKKGMSAEILDGDVVRRSISSDLGFSEEDREKNIQRVTQVAKMLANNRAAVLTSFISPYKYVRDNARKEIGDNFVEVFVNCPLEVCEERDVKGLYKKARAGEIDNFTGVSDPYEPPDNPEVVVNTHKESVEKCAQHIVNYLKRRNYIV